ncbi:hypothetical protein ABTM79_19625, partial [Acinetobacter baumannii]
YLMRRDNLGGYNAVDKIVQEFPHTMGGIWGGPAFFNNNVYFGGIFDNISAFSMVNGLFTGTGATMRSNTWFGYPGAVPSISSNG